MGTAYQDDNEPCPLHPTPKYTVTVNGRLPRRAESHWTGACVHRWYQVRTSTGRRSKSDRMVFYRIACLTDTRFSSRPVTVLFSSHRFETSEAQPVPYRSTLSAPVQFGSEPVVLVPCCGTDFFLCSSRSSSDLSGSLHAAGAIERDH